MFLINNINKLTRGRKGSTIGKIEMVKECNFTNVKDLNSHTSLKVCYLNNLKQKIIVPINHRETVEDLIEQNVDKSLCRKGHRVRKDKYH